MAKKKLLSEAQVRRFMGLAGMQSKIVSNYLKEEGDWGYNRDINEEEEEFPPEEEAPMDDAPMDELPPEEEAPMDDAAPEAEMPGEDVEVGETEIQAALDALGALEALVQPLADAAGLEAEAPEGGEDLGELPPEEPAMDAAPEEELPAPEEEEPAPEEEMLQEESEELQEEEVDEALAEVDIKLSKEEIINEVAKRVAQRILRAKKAQKAMNEALGNKK